jgi:hypothetical protein
MATQEENNFPYVRTIDFSWYGIDTNEVNRRFAEWSVRTRALYEELNALPDRQRISDFFIQWSRMAESDGLNAEQLRETLLRHFNMEMLPTKQDSINFWSQYKYAEATPENLKAWREWSRLTSRAERNAKYMDALADRILHGRVLSTIEAAHDYGIMRMVSSPDGVTDDYCYNFRSIGRKHKKNLTWQMYPLIGATNLDAYLLGRSHIVVQAHVRGTDIEETFTGPADYDKARLALVLHEKKMIRDWAADRAGQQRLKEWY